MIELFTAIPASMIIPIKAIMLSVCPVSRNAQIHPTPANGMVSRIVNGWRKDSNCAAITMYTNNMDRNRANPNPLNDSCRISSSPVILAEYLAGNSTSDNLALMAGVIWLSEYCFSSMAVTIPVRLWLTRLISFGADVISMSAISPRRYFFSPCTISIS